MLSGRFLLIVLVLALAGALARKQPVPPSAGTFPTGTPTVRRPARRRDPDRRRPHLPPDPRARADPGAPAAVTQEADLPLRPGAIVRAAAFSAFRKLDPRHVARNPVMFLVEVGSVVVTVLFVKDFGSSSDQENVFAGLIAAWLWFTVLFANFAEAMAEGRGKAQAATLRKTRAETLAHAPGRRGHRRGAERPSRGGRRRRRLGRRADPRRRRGDRGHRARRRVGDHGRVGARDPRVRRRPLGGDRRHRGCSPTRSSCA